MLQLSAFLHQVLPAKALYLTVSSFQNNGLVLSQVVKANGEVAEQMGQHLHESLGLAAVCSTCRFQAFVYDLPEHIQERVITGHIGDLIMIMPGPGYRHG